MVIEDNDIKIYLDWTFICSSNSIEQSVALIVGLYCLMNLTCQTYCTAIRFLYVYFMNDKQQQSNIIRKNCEVYNIQLHDNPSSSYIVSLEKTEINDVYSTNRHENEKEQNMSNEVQMRTSIEQTQFELIPFEQQPTRRRKSYEKLDSELLSHEIDSSKQKTTRKSPSKTTSTIKIHAYLQQKLFYQLSLSLLLSRSVRRFRYFSFKKGIHLFYLARLF